MKRPDRGTLILAAVLAVQLLPIWLLPFFPSQDGPVHMTIARTLRDYGRPEAGVLRQYFELNGEAVPNRFIYFVLADVLRFASVPVAEKILLSAYVILLPLAVRWAVAGVAPANSFLAVLALPFTFNFLLNMGFYNFSLSLVAFFVALGWWLRHRNRFGPWAAGVFAVLTVWVYFCHVVSLVALLSAVGAAALAKRDLRGLAWLALASLPAAALTVSYAGELGAYRGWLPLGDRLWRLATLNPLVSIDSRTDLLAAFLAVALAWAVFRLLGWRYEGGPETGLGFSVLALVVLVLAAPQAIGVGNFITDRLVLFPYLLLIPWLAACEHTPRSRLGLEILGAGAALAMLGLLVPRWQEANLYLAEQAPALERVEPGSTYLPLAFSYEGEAPDGGPVVHRILPFLHAGDHVAARTAVADLNLFAAGTDAFPIRYRPETNPYTHLRTRDGWSLAGQRIDYVLVWWPRARAPRLPEAGRLLVELEVAYDRIYTSPRDLVRLYRRRR
ncbi:MAG: hypothetical protein ABUT39_07020 [Acidobacteriota bacterium]